MIKTKYDNITITEYEGVDIIIYNAENDQSITLTPWNCDGLNLFDEAEYTADDATELIDEDIASDIERIEETIGTLPINARNHIELNLQRIYQCQYECIFRRDDE